LRLCAQLLIAVARAVHYAHQRGILHRDLKPANILLDRDGQPHVTDFGLAKKVEGGSDLTRSGAVLGTPSYMAPEQASGKKGLSTAADVYSLGAVLYELLTDRPLFRADNPLDTLLRVLDSDPEPPHRLNPALDADLETVCLKCLDKDPQRRYASAEELARDLERWLSGETILARPSTRWERAVKWARRRPAVSALMAVSAASLIAFLALAGFLWNNAELRAEAVQNLGKAEADLQAARAEHQKVAADTTRKEGELRQKHEEVERLKGVASQEQVKAVAAQDLARRSVYDADMQLAHAAWQTDNVPRLLGLLDRHRPKPGESDLRDLEWHYLHRLAHQDRFTLRWSAASPKPVNPDSFVLMALSPDGRTLATAGPSAPVRIWDRGSGRQLGHVAAPAGPVLGLTFADDGKALLVITATAENGTQQWFERLAAVAQGKEKPSLKPLAETLALQRLPLDGTAASTPEHFALDRLPAHVQFFAAGIRRAIPITQSATFAKKGGFFSPTSLALSPDRKTLAVAAVYTPSPFRVGNDKQMAVLLLWDLQQGRERALMRGHNTIITSLAFTPDSKLLASGSLDRTVRLWETATGASRGVLGGEGGMVVSLAFSPDGQRLAAACSDGTARLWSPLSGALQDTLRGHLNVLSAVAYTRDGKELATGSGDGTVKFWDPVRRQGFPTGPSDGGRVQGLAFSADGRTLTLVHEGATLRVLDTVTGAERARVRPKLKVPRVFQAAVSPDGGTVAVCWTGGTVELLDAATGAVRKSLTGPGLAHGVAYSADGKTLAVLAESGPRGNYRCAVRLWDTATWAELRTLEEWAGSAAGLALSRDGRFVAATSRPGAVRLWDARTGKPLLATDAKEEVTCLAFSADGRRLAWASGDQVTVAEVPGGKEVLTIRGYAHQAVRMAFSPDGARLVTAGGGIMTGREVSVKLWDLHTGQEVLSLRGKADSVTALAVSPDGRRLAAAFAEEPEINPLRNVQAEVRVWDATPVGERP
jgi:WD40 repeat protein